MFNVENFDSEEELYTMYFFEELRQAGIIEKIIYQPKPFLLTKPVKYNRIQALKSKTKQVECHLFHKHHYTADFIIHWIKEESDKILTKDLFDENHNHDNYFFAQTSEKSGKYLSIIDTKGSFAGRNNTSAVTFPLNQKWLWDKYKAYVQKVIPYSGDKKKNKVTVPGTSICLFSKIFTPKAYALRPLKNGKGYKKIPYQNVRTINQFLNKEI